MWATREWWWWETSPSGCKFRTLTGRDRQWDFTLTSTEIALSQVLRGTSCKNDLIAAAFTTIVLGTELCASVDAVNVGLIVLNDDQMWMRHDVQPIFRILCSYAAKREGALGSIPIVDLIFFFSFDADLAVVQVIFSDISRQYVASKHARHSPTREDQHGLFFSFLRNKNTIHSFTKY